MAGKKDAKIEIGVDGADSAAAAFSRIFGDADKAATRFFNSFSSVSDQAFKIVDTGIKSAIAGFDKIFSADVGKATEGLINFSRETSRMAEFFGRSSGAIKAEAMDLGRALGVSDEKAAALLLNFSKMTGSTESAGATLRQLGAEALLTGDSVEDVARTAAEMHARMGVPVEDLPAMFAKTRAAAEAMGTAGGPRALLDDLTALSGAASRLAGGAQSIAPVVAAAGKGLTQAQRRQGAERLLNFVAADTEPLRKQLGMKSSEFYDERGRVQADPAELLLRLQRDAIKRFGGRDAARRVMSQENNLGPLGSAMLFDLTPGAVAKAKAAQPKRAATDALTNIQDTPAELIARERAREESLRREVIGRMGMMIDKNSPEYTKFVKQHPLVRSGLASENVMKSAIEGGKSFTDSILGMDRLLGLMGAGDVTDLADRQRAFEQARRAQGKRTIAGVEAAGRAPDASTGDAQPTTATREAAATDPNIEALVKAVADRPVKVEVQIVPAAGVPEGAIQSYQSAQTKQ
jgi:hypothetical protein